MAPRQNAPLPVDPPVLFWVGPDDPHDFGGKIVPGVPARDLSEHDLARVVYQNTVNRRDTEGEGLGPLTEGSEFEATRADLVAFLVSTEMYSQKAPKAAAQPEKAEPTKASPEKADPATPPAQDS